MFEGIKNTSVGTLRKWESPYGNHGIKLPRAVHNKLNHVAVAESQYLTNIRKRGEYKKQIQTNHQIKDRNINSSNWRESIYAGKCPLIKGNVLEKDIFSNSDYF